MIKISDVKVGIFDKRPLKDIICERYGILPKDILDITIFKKSIDARRGHDVCFVYTFLVNAKNESIVLKKKYKNITPYEDKAYSFYEEKISSDIRPVIIGTGPSGLFCALMLSRAGLCPIVFERGQKVEEREKSVDSLRKNGILNTNSNIQFGEGGAGTFSDGKLTCGVNDKRNRFVLSEFVKAGAPDEILYNTKPHIGTDYLKVVVKNIRKEIESLGGEIHFDSFFTDLVIKDGKVRDVVICDVRNGDKKAIEAEIVVLALGHSSRDTYRMLKEKNINMQKKPFSVGVRIEHKREYINILQYKDKRVSETLPSADYKLSCHPDGRGVYTFCMCPGGEVVCSSSEDGGVVTNGMSYFARDMENSNSALLVSVYPEDILGDDPLGGIEFQREMEQKAFLFGEKDYFAPCQRVGDFMKKIPTTDLGQIKPSYMPGVTLCNLWDILPDFVAESLKNALIELDKKMKGFLFEDALLTGVETRSSSPLRITRDENMMSSTEGIYPIGEGAGYAGGIMSSAIDGIKCAEKIYEYLKNI